MHPVLDTQQVRASVARVLRVASVFSIDDVITLDALIPRCVDALQSDTPPVFPNFELSSERALETFLLAFGAAVEAETGGQYVPTIETLAPALRASCYGKNFATERIPANTLASVTSLAEARARRA